MELSTKEYDKLMESFITIKTIVSGFNEENYKTFFDYNKNLFDKLIKTYQELEDLSRKKFFLKSYLDLIEESLTEENEETKDSNNIKLKDLRTALDNLQYKIHYNKRFLQDNEIMIDKYEKYSILRDLAQDCNKFNYKDYNCELCYDKFSCSGSQENKYKHKFLGYFSKMENNVLYFKQGSNCYYYNKPFTSKVIIECGSNESISFSKKINGCDYEFIYTTKMACNSMKINWIKNKIKLFLSGI